MPDVDPYFGQTLYRLRIERGLSLRGLGQLAHRAKSHPHELETGSKQPSIEVARHLDLVLDANGRLAALVGATPSARDAAEAVELSRLVEASGIGPEALDLSGADRPRRTASARLDLGLALLAADKPDEASVVAQEAITSGRVVASNWWRATEVVAGVEAADVGEAKDLRDAYEAYRPGR